jgi:hypothetical protein
LGQDKRAGIRAIHSAGSDDIHLFFQIDKIRFNFRFLFKSVYCHDRQSDG